jgi:hypothetical protein
MSSGFDDSQLSSQHRRATRTTPPECATVRALGMATHVVEVGGTRHGVHQVRRRPEYAGMLRRRFAFPAQLLFLRHHSFP